MAAPDAMATYMGASGPRDQWAGSGSAGRARAFDQRHAVGGLQERLGGEAGQWCTLSLSRVPYGSLLAADFQAGETLLVSGATGNFGSAAVAVALAMGAGGVVYPGRNAVIDANAVVEHAAAESGPFERTVLRPSRHGVDVRPAGSRCSRDLELSTSSWIRSGNRRCRRR